MKKVLIVIVIISIFFFKSTSKIDNIEMIKEIMPTNGIIKINKIGLNHSFKDSKNVDKDIIVIKPSEYPYKENSLLILAAHSGSGPFAFFNYLYKLKINDEAIIEYDNKEYIYKLQYFYYEPKDGNVTIHKLKSTRTLVLVTCTNNVKNKQTIYIFKEFIH